MSQGTTSKAFPNTRGNAKRKPPTEEATAQEEKPQKFTYDEAKSHIEAEGLIPSTSSCSPQLLATALLTTAMTHSNKIPANIQKTITCLGLLASRMEAHCGGCARAADLPKILEDARLNIQMDIQEKMDELEKTIEGKLAGQSGISKMAERMEETARSLDKIATEVSEKVTKVSDTTTQLASTASSYRDALLRGNSMGPVGAQRQSPETEISMATDRKDRQVLIELEEAQLLAHSNEALLGKAEQAITEISDPPPPEDATIEQIAKIRKNGLIITFRAKEAANWLRQPEVGEKFTAQFMEGATVKPRQYPILVPRIPLTFNPGEDSHLREVEEGNGLGINVIAKARWIKPVYRRTLGQKAAHASFLLNDAAAANQCIKEGMYICGVKVYPNRLKQEPSQCMKCRGWGHFATDCTAQKDTCGTCGGEHRSSKCRVTDKRYCASCKSNAHASWDRNCPEFIKRCAWYDEKHPDNALKFFPTKEVSSAKMSNSYMALYARY
jgi:hypothetical protein